MLLGPAGPHVMLPSVLSSADQHPGIAGIRCRNAGTGTGAGGLAESIVRKSFDATYARLLDTDCTHNKTIMAGKCYREILRNHTNATDVALPWWFRTLLEESAKITSQWWMTLKSFDPPLRQCQLPKVGSKQWSIFMHIMNNDTRRDVDGKNISYSWNERGRNDAGPKFVVLRDPLERYLSAFLDKCVDPGQQWQKHCEPLPVFQGQIGKGWMKEIKADGRVFFDAYVHSSPLKWNMHFLPQALMCDGLYRTLHEYDFVGRMGPGFYSELQQMGQMFDERVDQALVEVFDYKTKLKEEEAKMKGEEAASTNPGRISSNSIEGIETRASSKVARYYTPATVWKVLEYTSIDYILLNLTIPPWAEEMLRLDEAKMQQQEY